MREILFRGKNKYGKWYYGYYTEGYYLDGTPVSWIEVVDRKKKETDSPTVIPETVGQFTGLTDKNGKKIFEGDIVRDSYNSVGIVEFGTGTFDSGVYCYTGWHRRERDGCVDHTELHDYGWPKEFEVIGNIHDNPELLGGVGGG